jgi:hypothetical protein
MEIRSHRRIRDLVAHTAFQGLDANEIGCVRISMMAGSNTLRSKGRIQMSETSHLQISHIRLATHGRSIQMCHVWTAPSWQGFSSRLQAGRCGHVFGLLARHTGRWP